MKIRGSVQKTQQINLSPRKVKTESRGRGDRETERYFPEWKYFSFQIASSLNPQPNGGKQTYSKTYKISECQAQRENSRYFQKFLKITWKGPQSRMVSDLSAATLEARTHPNSCFRILREMISSINQQDYMFSVLNCMSCSKKSFPEICWRMCLLKQGSGPRKLKLCGQKQEVPPGGRRRGFPG